MSRATPSRCAFLRQAVSRREFLAFLACGGAGAGLAACAPTPGPTPLPPTPPTAAPTPSAQPVPTSLSGPPIGTAAAHTPTPTAAPPTPSPTVAPPTSTPRSLDTLSPATYAHLPRWRGFNLLEKFTLADDKPYVEWDFDFMVEWGFDFVRLPTDYRIWTVAPGEYREQRLQEIDQAIAWARQRGIHANLCLHRAPGYCVNPPREALDLWAGDAGGEEARRQFAEQWRMFAARYRGIPAAELSFDLVNEPGEVTGEQYARAAGAAVVAIREADPDRLVIADGAQWGMRPVPELAPLHIAQSTRGYAPMQISHYRASWVDGSSDWPVPTWPIPAAINRYLYGDEKPDLSRPLILKGDFSATGELTVVVHQVSHQAHLVVRAGEAPLFDKWFKPGPGQGEWQESVYKPEWDIYQAIYDKAYTAALPAGSREVRLEVIEGDWLTFSEIRIRPYPGAPGNELVLKPGDMEWGVRQEAFTVSGQGNVAAASGRAGADKTTLWTQYVKPWQDFAALAGVGVHVGEWGAYSYTPHGVVLAWMQDCLDNWKQAGIGWALWNLRGSFGPLDSERADVMYEAYQGHQLDRQMLEVLRRG
jgi:aryl-phospho-beta-D-glucosidase BglC (GH1 family)